MFFLLYFQKEDDDDEPEDDDEDEEDQPEDGYDQVLKEQEKNQRESHDLHRHRSLYNRMEKEDDIKEIADYFKQRYSKNYESDRFGTSNQLTDTISQQKLLPGVK